MLRASDVAIEDGNAAGPRIAPALLIAAVLAALTIYAVPRGIDAQAMLSMQDDPARIADRALDETFNGEIAEREIAAALATNDADLAKSFADLARDRGIVVDPALVARADAAAAQAATAQHAAESFARGFVTGEPEDMAGFAGTALGDLFVFGDVRDAARGGARFVRGEKVDRLILGLACVGLAITAGTYATLGGAAPARVGLSVAKAARRTGRLSADLAAYIGRALRRVVDWDRLRTAIAGASIAQPAIAVRAARAAVKVERAGGLMDLVRNVGRVQRRAGTQAALDGLKIADTPREMSRLAKLAEKSGNRTRAIIKLVGRGAIALTVATFQLGMWVLWAVFMLFAFTASLKSTTERVTLRIVRRRRERRRLEQQRRFAALAVRG